MLKVVVIELLEVIIRDVLLVYCEIIGKGEVELGRERLRI